MTTSYADRLRSPLAFHADEQWRLLPASEPTPHEDYRVVALMGIRTVLGSH